jgi:integrase
VLEMRRHTPDGTVHPLDAYVFGSEAGERVGRVHTASRATCRGAGIKDLHFHALRREFASRLFESGAADHDVRGWLGHANIRTTSLYLATIGVRLQQTRIRFEDHKVHRSTTVSDSTQPASDHTAESLQRAS